MGGFDVDVGDAELVVCRSHSVFVKSRPEVDRRTALSHQLSARDGDRVDALGLSQPPVRWLRHYTTDDAQGPAPGLRCEWYSSRDCRRRMVRVDVEDATPEPGDWIVRIVVDSH